MPEFLKQQVFLGLRFIDVILLAGGLIIAAGVLSRIVAHFRDESLKGHQSLMRCLQCGWSGMASKHALRCPKCGNKNLSGSKR